MEISCKLRFWTRNMIRYDVTFSVPSNTVQAKWNNIQAKSNIKQHARQASQANRTLHAPSSTTFREISITRKSSLVLHINSHPHPNHHNLHIHIGNYITPLKLLLAAHRPSPEWCSRCWRSGSGRHTKWKSCSISPKISRGPLRLSIGLPLRRWVWSSLRPFHFRSFKHLL